MSSFPKSVRLLNKKEFERLKKGAKTAANRFFTFRWILGDKRRLGIIVPKTAGNAVTRNRIKRVTREYFRINREKFPDGDLVIIARSSMADLSGQEIRIKLVDLLDRWVGKW